MVVGGLAASAAPTADVLAWRDGVSTAGEAEAVTFDLQVLPQLARLHKLLERREIDDATYDESSALLLALIQSCAS